MSPQLRGARNLDREAYICEQLGAGRTLQSVGDELGITRERVRQLANRSGLLPVAYRREVRREAIKVDFTCPACGVQKRVSKQWLAVHRYCRPGCKIETLGYAYRRDTDGHWWTHDPFGRTATNRCRAERAIAQRQLGRKLRSNEWVRLKDRNPDNLDPANIEIVTPSSVAVERWARKSGSVAA